MATKLSSTSATSSSGSSTTTGSSSTALTGKVDKNTQAQKDKYGQEWQASGQVVDAWNKLQSSLANKPTFDSKYKDKVQDIYNKLENREDFSYNFNADKLYQQYNQQYQKIGKKAMQDSIADAAKLASGYGNTYAESVGQQQYQEYLKDINDILPQLYELAYEKYSGETEDLLTQYGMASDLYKTEYGEYRDRMKDYQADRGFYSGMYRNERDFDYNKHKDNREFWTDEYWRQREAEKTTKSEQTTHSSESTSSVQTDVYMDEPKKEKSSKGTKAKKESKLDGWYKEWANSVYHQKKEEAGNDWNRSYIESQDEHLPHDYQKVIESRKLEFLMHKLEKGKITEEEFAQYVYDQGLWAVAEELKKKEEEIWRKKP